MAKLNILFIFLIPMFAGASEFASDASLTQSKISEFIELFSQGKPDDAVVCLEKGNLSPLVVGEARSKLVEEMANSSLKIREFNGEFRKNTRYISNFRTSVGPIVEDHYVYLVDYERDNDVIWLVSLTGKKNSTGAMDWVLSGMLVGDPALKKILESTR